MLSAELYVWVSGVGVPIALALLGWLFKTNTEQHKNGQAAQDARQEVLLTAISEVRDDIKGVDQRLDEHIQWHLGVTKKGAA